MRRVVSEAASLEARGLLLWILAWAGVWAAWQIDDNLYPGIELRVAEVAWPPSRPDAHGGSPRFTRIFKLHQLAADPAQRIIEG